MPIAHVNEIDINYLQRGAGPRLLFLGGSGQTLESIELMIQPFTEVFTVVAHDQRGLGRTSKPPGPYTMTDYATDAAGLLDQLAWESCRVVGVSFGGMVAQELAVTSPARIERLALLCTSPGGAGGSSFPLHELAALPPAGRLVRSRTLLDTRFTDTWLERHPDDRALVDLIARRAEEPTTADDARGASEQLEARRHHDVFERLGAITCPTLVACGRYDGIAPPANSEAIAARIPDAEQRSYEGGHAFFAQDPAAFLDVITFMQSAAP